MKYILSVVLGLIAVVAVNCLQESNFQDRIKQTLWKNVPECLELTEGENMFEFPSCSEEINECMKEVHQKARGCVMQEMRHWMKVPKAKACHKQHKHLYADWFKSSCRWHLALKKCMVGEEPGPEYEFEESDGDLVLENPRIQHYKAVSCWAQVGQKSVECKTKAAAECEDFKYCAGMGEAPTDERLGKWFNVAQNLKHEKHTKAKVMKETFKECMGEDLAEHEDAENEV